MNISEDDYVMYRNQLIRFIKNNFYTELKEFWDRNTKRDGENINESQSKKMIQRRYEIINNYIEGNMNLSWICDYNDPLDYIVIVLDRTAEYLFDSILIPGINDVNHNLYQEVYDFISENFSDKLYDFYNENIHKCQSENFNRWR
jgi:hypothetical protein